MTEALMYFAVGGAAFLTLALLGALVYCGVVGLPFVRALATTAIAIVVGAVVAVPLLWVAFEAGQSMGMPTGAWFATMVTPAALLDALVQTVVTVGLNCSFEGRRRLAWVAAIVTGLASLAVFDGLGYPLVMALGSP